MSTPIIKSITELPAPVDSEQASRMFADQFGEPAGDISEAHAALRDLAGSEPSVMRLLQAVYGASPHLSGLVNRHPAVVTDVLSQGPDDVVSSLIAETRRALNCDSEADLMTALRLAKAKVALAIGIADIAGLWSVPEVTGALSRFADAALGTAIDWLFRDAAGRGVMTLADPASPGVGSGYIVLAMGKYGAFELNYSSDIDLIVFYDPEIAPLAEGVEPSTHFVRLTRRMVKLLQERTGDGYVFRVDLRLRPDPRATNVAIAVEAGAAYYESLGQNWERAAMIKARCAAGDIDAGNEFLQRLAPFVWRKYLDFASIADVHSMKRQIHAFKGHGEIAVYGHNIKLGRGGIREIEFFVQTQQLIAGGRATQLRGNQTLAMLDVLAQGDWITPETAEDMKHAYVFLRSIEHRIQMQNDDQTHSLPKTVEELERFARFAGFESRDVFAAQLLERLNAVQEHYAALFEHAPSLGDDGGSLVFTGGEDDPDTLETLQQMGFERPSEVSALVRDWHFGRYAATRSARARERLTELMPVLLRALSKTADPDAAFIAFDRFLKGLPAGVQLFSLLWSNPKLMELLADIAGTAPRLAGLLSQRPQILDAVLDPGFFSALPDAEQARSLVTERILAAGDFEAALDQARVRGQEQAFRIGVQVLSGTASAAEAGAAYSALADAEIAGLLDAVAREIAQRHGVIDGGAVVVVAMGKLGGREMTAASDLDLMLIYDFDDAVDRSDGARPLMAGQYYARLTQRLISALSAPTAEGSLYEVDMRLRPSGNSGPIATRINGFVDYQRDSAWVWEKLALTRARVVAGDAELADRVRAAACEALAQPRDAGATANDVIEMRERIEKEKGTEDPWEIKQVRGGLVDLEFIAQYLQIVHAHDLPSVLDQNTAGAFARMHDAGIVDDEQAAVLTGACGLFHGLTQILRLCLSGPFDARNAPAGLQALLARSGNAPDFAALESTLTDTQLQVKTSFDQLVRPAP